MIIISNGNLEIGAQVWTEIGILICFVFVLIRSRAVANFDITLLEKSLFATISEFNHLLKVP